MVPTLGSIVQKGKLALCAFAFDKQLNKVDLPTFGNPTIPHFKAIENKLKVIFINESAKKQKSPEYYYSGLF
jgi:hypothetical protein